MAVFSISSIVAIIRSHKKLKSVSSSSSSSSSSSIKHGKTDSSASAPRKLMSKLNSNVSDKAQLIAKMISWKKTPSEEVYAYDEVEDEDEDEALWRKTIMRGEKCRPLDFSGQILYDSQGNLLKV